MEIIQIHSSYINLEKTISSISLYEYSEKYQKLIESAMISYYETITQIL